MAASNPLGAIPTGTFPLRLAPGLGESSTGEGSKKRKRQSDNIVGLRYNFKPASITPDIPGGIHSENGSRSLKFDMPSGGQQVFDLREETAKPRECVLIWDDDTQSFTLHPLSSTLQLTLNRSASSTTASSGPSSAPFSASSALSANNNRHHPRPPSTSSSTSSAAVPLSAHTASGGADARKRSRPSVEPSVIAGGSKGGKTLPRKQPLPTSSASSGPKLTSNSTKPKTKTKPKASASAKGKGKSTAKGEESKIKSAEIIEDSDEEAAGYDISGNAPEEEEDEFAMLVGQSLAGGLDDDADEDEEEDEEEEDEGEEEDEALGGAKVVLEADGSEWV